MKNFFIAPLFTLMVLSFSQTVLADNLLQVFTSKDYNSVDNSTSLYWRTSSSVPKVVLSFNCLNSSENLHLVTEQGANFYCGSETTLSNWVNTKEGSVRLSAVNLSDIKNPVIVNFTLSLKKNDDSLIKQSKVLSIRFNPTSNSTIDHIPLLSSLTSEETKAYGGATLFSWMTKDADEVNLIIKNSSLTSKTCLSQFKITNVETKEILACGDLDRRMPANGSIYLKFENLNPEDASAFLEVAPIRSSFNGTIPLSQNASFIIPSSFVLAPLIITPTPTPTAAITVGSTLASNAGDEALKKQIAELKKIIADLQKRIAEILAKRALIKSY